MGGCGPHVLSGGDRDHLRDLLFGTTPSCPEPWGGVGGSSGSPELLLGLAVPKAEPPTPDPTAVPDSGSLRVLEGVGTPAWVCMRVIFRGLLFLLLRSLLESHLLSDRSIEVWAGPHWPEPPSHDRDGVQDHEEKPRG